MPSPSANPTPITPPRVPFIDARTGLIDRAWYMFFLSLFDAAQTVVDNPDVGPNAASLIASYDEALRKLAQFAETQPPQVDCCDEVDQLKNVALAQPPYQTGELQQQLNTLRQTFETLPRAELGTMAALQQANLPWVTFDTTPQSVPEATTGTLYWDSADRSKTLALVMEDTGQIIQDIGEETFYRVKASASTTKGQVMMFTGTVGASGGIIAAPATGLTSTQSEYILGIATQDIALNGWGYVTWFGEIKGVNTTGGAEAWVDGQILYYNPAVTGGLTKNVPIAPNPKVIVAAVVHAASNGILFVRPTFGSALGATDSNVEITAPADGNLLIYDSVQSRWENASLTAGTNITITNGPGAITIASTTSTSGATGSVTLAKITTLGTDGSLTFANGLITGYTAPT
jgi:hypothetical protein